MVCAADKIHNLSALMDSYKNFGKKALAKFNAPIEKKMQFYGKTLSILKRRLKNKSVQDLEKVYKEAKEIFG